MKHTGKLIGIFALIAVIGLFMASCDTGGGGGGPDLQTQLPTHEFTIEGKFTKSGVAGSGEVSFKLADANNYSRAAARAAQDSFAVKGELLDGDILMRLSGTYNPTAKSYAVSAASSILTYSIKGAFDESGNDIGATATLAIRTGGNAGQVFTFDVTAQESGTFAAQEEALAAATVQETEQPGGIPSNLRGLWLLSYSDSGNGYSYSIDAKAVVTQWNMDVSANWNDNGIKGNDSYTATVIEVSGSGPWDVIIGYPVYIPSNEAQAVAAVTAFLTSKGKSAAKVTWNNDFHCPNFSGNGMQYYIDEHNDYQISWCNIPDSLIQEWYASDYLTKYLIGQHATATMRYEKDRFTLVGSNLRMQYYAKKGNYFYQDAPAEFLQQMQAQGIDTSPDNPENYEWNSEFPTVTALKAAGTDGTLILNYPGNEPIELHR